MSWHHVIKCTTETPWNGKKMEDERVQHYDVEEVGDQENGWPGGDIVTYRCKNCGHKWRAELAQ